MPHIVLEYPFDFKEKSNVISCLSELHSVLGAFDTIDIARIKTRAIPIEHAVVGTEVSSGYFMHITLKLLPGRDKDLKKAMALALQNVAKQWVSDIDTDCTVTAEVQDLEAESYCS
jgi:5-carboxymethyl-2-hydroxymuconate isomerase